MRMKGLEEDKVYCGKCRFFGLTSRSSCCNKVIGKLVSYKRKYNEYAAPGDCNRTNNCEYYEDRLIKRTIVKVKNMWKGCIRK